MIKRIAQTAGFAGLLAALLLTLLQILWVTPLILEAETYEKSEPVAAQPHEHAPGVAAHVHDEEAWEPEDGWQRTLSTTGGNLVVAVGFALMLAGLFTLRAPGQTWQGLLWGLAGYAVFCLAPSLGLPPELPGTAAADLVQRQYWWIATAAATAVGLALLVFGGNWPLKLVGAVLLALPHLFGAPQPEVHASLAPEALAQRFVVAVHDEEAWEPEDGWQRTLSTTGGNLVVAVGFALMLAGLFTLRAPGQTWQGLLWGLAGYAVFCLAPSLGLPPELPGTAAADLVQRQYWWIATAAATAVGLALLVFGGNWPLKLVGAVLLALPHLFGAPQPEVHASLAPEALAQRFVVASLVSNALFWAALGLAAAWLFRRNRGGVDA